LPSVLLLFQTYYLAKQNTLITNQSELFLEQTNRLDQQTYLQEADRRAAVILSLDNLISEVNDEISNGRPLSQATTGRLVAFSKILKPYRYLENDSLTIRPISPERGYLLTVLLESPVRLNSRLSRSQPTLKERLDFTYAELRGATIVREDLQQIDLSFADLQEAKLTGTDFKNSDFKEVTFKNTDFSFASLEGSNLEGAVLTNANLNGTNLKKAKLYGANLLNVRLNNTVIVDSEFNEALVSEDFFASAKANLDEANFKYLSENFLMEEKEKGVYWLISKKTED
ncbi:MAG: pentapeptide repeat-containing protein, partial [Leeuwenhoekiella sp.]